MATCLVCGDRQHQSWCPILNPPPPPPVTVLSQCQCGHGKSQHRFIFVYGTTGRYEECRILGCRCCTYIDSEASP